MPGTSELLVIFVLVLILFGPDKIPDLARTIGKGMREIRKATSEIRSQFKFYDD